MGQVARTVAERSGSRLTRLTRASGGARGQAHRMAKLAVADDLALKRRPTTHLAAQLADNATCLRVHVYALAHEWRAIAVDAAVAISSQRADTAAQEEALELLYVDMGRVHARYFRQDQAGSCTLH